MRPMQTESTGAGIGVVGAKGEESNNPGPVARCLDAREGDSRGGSLLRFHVRRSPQAGLTQRLLAHLAIRDRPPPE